MAHDLRDWTRGLLLLANVIAATASAVFWVLLFLAPGVFGQEPLDEGRELVTDVRSRPGFQLAALLALVLLVCNVLWLMRRRRNSHAPRHVSSTAPGGVVSVACDVIERALRAAGEELDEIAKLRVVVDASRPRRVVIRAQFQTPDGIAIREASQRLREALARRFDELVVPVEGTRIDYEVEFHGFLGPATRRPPDPVPEPAEEPRPFRGPEYPIDEGEDLGGSPS